MAMTVVVAYDISDDSRRARVAATLQTHGDRIQRSVFLCTIDHDELTTITEHLSDIIDTDHDSIYLFRECTACWDNCIVIGQATIEPAPLYWAVL